MLKKILHTSCAIALCMLCTSCASLRCKHFPGTREPLTEKELSHASVWKYGDEIYHVKVVSSNQVVACSVKWDDETARHALESFEVVPSKLEETIFLNILKDGLYTILRVMPAGEKSMVLMTIDRDKVEKDIAEGKIKGARKGGEYTLDCSQQELDDYIRANLTTLFSLDAAGVLELIKGELKK